MHGGCWTIQKTNPWVLEVLVWRKGDEDRCILTNSSQLSLTFKGSIAAEGTRMWSISRSMACKQQLWLSLWVQGSLWEMYISAQLSCSAGATLSVFLTKGMLLFIGIAGVSTNRQTRPLPPIWPGFHAPIVCLQEASPGSDPHHTTWSPPPVSSPTWLADPFTLP